MNGTNLATLDLIIALCKRRGFVYQSADLYGGLNGLYDFGHLGVLMKNKIKDEWYRSLFSTGLDIVLFDGSILGPEIVWQASGHEQNFNDPMVDCMNCKRRYRADDPDVANGCPHCGSNKWTAVQQFNMMFQTNLGAAANSSATAYLRPETAQTIFSNFKNIMSSNRVKVPFGVAQIGKAFRNEITPKQFLFRVREFEQMELEWFCHKDESQLFFDFWCKARFDFYRSIGLTEKNVHLRPHSKDELAHYSSQCVDVEYQFPFGWKELEGIADRSNYDLVQHGLFSKKDLSVYDERTATSLVPHVIESSVGVGRLLLSILFDAYNQDTIEGDERTVLRLSPKVAPITAAILPLSKKLTEPAFKIFKDLVPQYGPHVEFDDTGSIGKRYRRYDEIGTPVCFTYDFDSQVDGCVTARNRDTLAQERVSIDFVNQYLQDVIK